MAEKKSGITREEFLHWYHNCDPTTPVGPDSGLYVDFGELHEEKSSRSRPQWRGIMRLYEAIDFNQESCQLFSGYSGTGKSTELQRLKKFLEEQEYLVLLIDAERYLALSQSLKIEDFMILTAGGFADAVREELGEDFADVSYWERFNELLKTGVHLDRVQASLGAVSAGISFSEAKPLWMRVREHLAVAPKKLLEERDRFVAGCMERISDSDKKIRGVVLIVDSLERLKPTIHIDFSQIMASLNHILVEYSVYLRLAKCHVIYSVPPYVQLISTGLPGRYNGRGFVLPAIRVTESGTSDVKAYAPGVSAMREILAKRVDLDRVFGGEEKLIEKLIMSSGGHMRTLIAFMQDILSMLGPERLPVIEEDLEEVFRAFRRGVTLILNDDNVLLLDQVAQTNSIRQVATGDHERLASLMDNYLVLCYRNGDDLFDIHPLIRKEVLTRAAEIRRSEAADD